VQVARAATHPSGSGGVDRLSVAVVQGLPARARFCSWDRHRDQDVADHVRGRPARRPQAEELGPTQKRLAPFLKMPHIVWRDFGPDFALKTGTTWFSETNRWSVGKCASSFGRDSPRVHQ